MRRQSLVLPLHVLLIAGLCLSNSSTFAQPIGFDRTVIDADFPGAYQVEVADVDGDKKLDVIAVGGGTCAWYQNPSWKKRIVTGPKQTPGIISSATTDITGDGKAEIAIAYDFEMNTPTKGKLLLASSGANLDEPWTLKPLEEIGSIHRLRWGDLNGDGKRDLVVAPIFGRKAKPPKFDEENASLSVFYFRSEGGEIRWEVEVPFASFPVMHAIDVIADSEQGGRSVIFTASNTGVTKLVKGGTNLLGSWFQQPVAPGATGVVPKIGSSEIHLGGFGEQQKFVTTIEPWHGSDVVVYSKDKPTDPWPGKRQVIDDQLIDGHALWVADVDGDGIDEIFAGHRGLDHRVSMYSFDTVQKKGWKRTILDRNIAAQDLRGGDLDGDGKPDIVAVGGSTHNVVWYHPRKANP